MKENEYAEALADLWLTVDAFLDGLATLTELEAARERFRSLGDGYATQRSLEQDRAENH